MFSHEYEREASRQVTDRSHYLQHLVFVMNWTKRVRLCDSDMGTHKRVEPAEWVSEETTQRTVFLHFNVMQQPETSVGGLIDTQNQIVQPSYVKHKIYGE